MGKWYVKETADLRDAWFEQKWLRDTWKRESADTMAYASFEQKWYHSTRYLKESAYIMAKTYLRKKALVIREGGQVEFLCVKL